MIDVDGKAVCGRERQEQEGPHRVIALALWHQHGPRPDRRNRAVERDSRRPGVAQGDRCSDAREREQLLNLAEQSNRPGWWQRYDDILPEWFVPYVGLEEAARSIRVYETQLIPMLLQTEEYATEVISLGDFPREEAERLVAIRKERQRRFRDSKLKLWVILDEAALRRPVADIKVQLEQLRCLREACSSPTLTLQVLPYGAGRHAAPTGFSILRFAENDLPDVIYVENLTSALYLDKAADVNRYLLAMERLTILGLRAT